MILVELRKRLDSAKGRWPEELVKVLWAYRCTPQSSTNESLFSLVYGADTMIPVEIGEPSQIRNLATKQRAAKKYNANLCPRSFVSGDLVWRMASSARKKDGKFSTN